jgi:hypothetical protein
MTAAAHSPQDTVRDAANVHKLQAIASSGVCESGRVVVLDFAAVRAASGDRWPSRQAEVQLRIERELARQLSGSASFIKLSDTQYLVLLDDVLGLQAQVRAFSIMEGLLVYFLERFDPQDLSVNVVSAINGDQIDMRPLSRSEVQQGSIREADRVSLRLEPQNIVHVSTGLNIGTRLAVNLHQFGSTQLLTSRDVCSISANSLLQSSLLGIAELRQIMEASDKPAVFILPLFLQTLTSTRRRAALLDELRRLRPLDQRRLVIEIAGIERGTPSSRLVEASWQVRPFCRAVGGRAPLERSTLISISAARLSAIHLSATDLGMTDSQRAAGLLAAGQSTKGLASMTVALDLPHGELLNVCAVAGFTHATVPATAP